MLCQQQGRVETPLCPAQLVHGHGNQQWAWGQGIFHAGGAVHQAGQCARPSGLRLVFELCNQIDPRPLVTHGRQCVMPRRRICQAFWTMRCGAGPLQCTAKASGNWLGKGCDTFITHRASRPCFADGALAGQPGPGSVRRQAGLPACGFQSLRKPGAQAKSHEVNILRTPFQQQFTF